MGIDVFSDMVSFQVILPQINKLKQYVMLLLLVMKHIKCWISSLMLIWTQIMVIVPVFTNVFQSLTIFIFNPVSNEQFLERYSKSLLIYSNCFYSYQFKHFSLQLIRIYLMRWKRKVSSACLSGLVTW